LSFEQLNLDARLLRAIAACHFKAPTDIQRQAIPVALDGRDLMASAQTGTGKTAAFVLPALQRLITTPSAVRGRGPRVLVLTPTRELAMQVTDNIRQFSRECRVTSGSIVGGMSYGPQFKLLQQPLDLLVATPGRLMDHMEQGKVDFSRVEVLVLDEADRMLDMGFVNAVKEIAAELPSRRQTLLFSATLEGKVLEIARQLLKDPARIQLAAVRDPHEAIAQHVHEADDAAHKNALLDHYLADDALYQAVIFIATKHAADKLAKKLTAQGHKAAPLHGNMNQNKRKRTIEAMRRGEFRLLVATDVAARGLDIKGISHVINFDLPMVAEDYVHRIGRTGRAGATGIAVSFVDHEDRGLLRDIERLTNRKLERKTVAGLEPTARAPSGPSHRPARPHHAPHHAPRHAPRSGARPGSHHAHHAAPRTDGARGGPQREVNGNVRHDPRNEARHQHRGPHAIAGDRGDSGGRRPNTSGQRPKRGGSFARRPV
jgi:superfamily II DNA/RNA helicase